MNNFIFSDINNKTVLGVDFRKILNPVKHRIDVHKMRSWQSALNEQYSRDQKGQLIIICVQYLNENRNHSDPQWFDAIIYITLFRICHLEVPWESKFPDYIAGLSQEELIIKKLNALYLNWSVDPSEWPCAKPYAFCMVVEAAFKVSNINQIRIAESDFKNCITNKAYSEFLKYLNFLPNNYSGSVSNENHLIAFVNQYAENNGTPISHASEDDIGVWSLDLIEKSAGQLSRKTEKERFVILFAGRRNSGKSLIITNTFNSNSLVHYEQTPFNELVVRNIPERGRVYFSTLLQDGLPPATDIPAFVFEGNLSLSKKNHPFLLIDTMGEHMDSDPRLDPTEIEIKYVNDVISSGIVKFPKDFSEQAWSKEIDLFFPKSDLIIFIIDPHTLFELTSNNEFSQKFINGIVSRYDLIFKESKHVMISFVFSKFDEYSVIIKGNRRLINNHNQLEAILNYMKNGSGKDWKKYWDELINSITEQFTLKDFEGKPLDDTNSKMLKETLKSIFNRIIGLLKPLLSDRKYPAINFYLTSTLNESKDGDDFERSGIAPIFRDFKTYIDWLINIGNQTVIKAEYKTEKNEIEIVWNTNDNDSVTYTVWRCQFSEQKFSDYKELGILNFNGRNEGSYYDKYADNGQIYKYQLRSNLNKKNIDVPYPVYCPPSNIRNLQARIEKISSETNKFALAITWEFEKPEYQFRFKLRRKQLNNYNSNNEWENLALATSETSYKDENVGLGKCYSYELTLCGDVYRGNTKSILESQPVAINICLPKKPINRRLIIGIIIILIIIAIIIKVVYFGLLIT